MFPWKRRNSGIPFRATERDAATDASRAELILKIVDKITNDAEAEQAGLQRRLENLLAQSSVTFGTATDEYLTREASRNDSQSAFGNEIRYAEGRLKRLDETIECYRSFRTFIVTALRSTWEGAD